MNRLGHRHHDLAAGPTGGPTGRLNRELALALADDGWDVIAIDDAASPDYPVSPWRRVMALIRLYRQARQIAKPIAVISMTDPPGLGLVGWWLARRWGCVSLHWCQDLYPDLLWPRLGRWLRRLHPGHDRVVVPGPCMAKSVMAKNGMATVMLNWPEADIEATPLPSGPTRWLYSGNFGWAADLAGLLAAWKILANHQKAPLLTLCGRGRRQQHWQQRARHLGLQDVVHWSPPVPVADLSAHLGAASVHVVVQARKTAGCLVPIKFMAAMAAGRPVLALVPPQSSVAIWVRQHQLGWVVDPDDAVAIAAIVEQIADHPAMIADYAARARRWFDDQQLAGGATGGPKALAALITGWLDP